MKGSRCALENEAAELKALARRAMAPVGGNAVDAERLYREALARMPGDAEVRSWGYC
jgi:hypothetical protein